MPGKGFGVSSLVGCAGVSAGMGRVGVQIINLALVVDGEGILESSSPDAVSSPTFPPFLALCDRLAF